MISLIITLAVVGLITWLIITYIPMPPVFKQVILVVVAICVIIFVLNAFGIIGRDIPVPQVG